MMKTTTDGKMEKMMEVKREKIKIKGKGGRPTGQTDWSRLVYYPC